MDELYSTLPLDEVEGLEDLVTAGPLVKVTFCCNISMCLILPLCGNRKCCICLAKRVHDFRNLFGFQDIFTVITSHLALDLEIT